MEKLKMGVYYPAILICRGILVTTGSYFVYNAYLPPEKLNRDVPGSTQDPESLCNLSAVGPVVPVMAGTVLSLFLLQRIQALFNAGESGFYRSNRFVYTVTF
jgi:hypothetical protein